MINKGNKSQQIARIGFELKDHNIHDVTGYCAAEMAVAFANRKGDLPCAIELIPIIDNKKPVVARWAAQQFVEDPTTVGVLGPLNSDMALSNQDIYHNSGIAQLTSEASSPLLTNKGYKNFFRLVANDEYQGRDLARIAVQYLKGTRIAVLHDNTAWGRPIAEIFSNEAKYLGSEPILFQGFSDREKNLDFEQFVQTIFDADPDVVYFAIYWDKAHIIAHKLRYSGLKAVFLGSDALKPFPFLEVPSLDVISPYHSLAGVDIRQKSSARAFFKEFAFNYPMMMSAPQYAAEAYDCASLLIESLKRAGALDRSSILNELKNIENFEGAIGLINFDEKGDIIEPEIGLYQCRDGLRKYIGPIRTLVK